MKIFPMKSSRLRAATPQRLRDRVDAELNLIPMIDILSVMVAFLLLYSADVEVIQSSRGVEIPQSVAEEQPKHSVVVMLTRDALFVQGEPVTSVAEILGGGNALIEPLRAVLDRPMSAEEGSMEEREITLMSDRSVPYAVVKKVLETCTASSYAKISLAVLEKVKPVASTRARPA